MYARFTDLARKVLQLANEEAQRFRHEYIGTEHILLGLVRTGTGVAADVLRNLHIDPQSVTREIEMIVMPGPDAVGLGKKPQTPRAKKVIEYAIEEARNLNHDSVGTEHLLLGLLRESEGVAGQVLINLGVHLRDVQNEMLTMLGPQPQTGIVDLSIRRSPALAESLSDIQKLPDHVQKIVAEFDWQIKQLRREKDTFVAYQNLDRAMTLMEHERKLVEQRALFIAEWRGEVK